MFSPLTIQQLHALHNAIRGRQQVTPTPAVLI